jgi:pimeloyl-ACP methyl ester carboxylesterase
VGVVVQEHREQVALQVPGGASGSERGPGGRPALVLGRHGSAGVGRQQREVRHPLRRPPRQGHRDDPAEGEPRQRAAQTTRVDERPALARVRVPTLVLAGALDRLCPVDRHEEMAALVPGARLEVLDGVGHLLPLEAPDRVAAALDAWLAA